MVDRALIGSASAPAVTALALFSLLLAAPVLAQRRVDVRLPACTPTHVDVALLRELLEIELGDADGGAIEATLGAALCDAASESIEVSIRDPLPVGGASVGRDVFAIPADLDPRARARALALAIAERARLLLASTEVALAVAEPVAPPPVAPPPVAPPPVAEPRVAAAIVPAPTERAEALASPGVETETPSAPRALPATVGLAIRGRMAPVLPSWALGLRADSGAHLDSTWSLRGEIFGTWSRGSAPEGDADAAVIAAAGALGLSIHRDASIDLAIALRAEAGLLVAIGTLMGGTPGRTTAHPWGAVGAELGLTWWLTPGLALVADLGVSAVVFGTQIVSAPSGTQIDLSIVTIDLGAGVRVPI